MRYEAAHPSYLYVHTIYHSFARMIPQECLIERFESTRRRTVLNDKVYEKGVGAICQWY